MAPYNSKDHNSSEDNDDIPHILLLSIQRYHQLNESSNNKINTQPIRFSDTIDVQTNDGTQVQYTLTGYVLFNGSHTKGHYRVICRGQNNRWFLYDDETTKDLNPRERDNHWYKTQVVLLLYAEQSYYNNESAECDGVI